MQGREHQRLANATIGRQCYIICPESRSVTLTADISPVRHFQDTGLVQGGAGGKCNTARNPQCLSLGHWKHTQNFPPILIWHFCGHTRNIALSFLCNWTIFLIFLSSPEYWQLYTGLQRIILFNVGKWRRHKWTLVVIERARVLSRSMHCWQLEWKRSEYLIIQLGRSNATTYYGNRKSSPGLSSLDGMSWGLSIYSCEHQRTSIKESSVQTPTSTAQCSMLTFTIFAWVSFLVSSPTVKAISI